MFKELYIDKRLQRGLLFASLFLLPSITVFAQAPAAIEQQKPSTDENIVREYTFLKEQTQNFQAYNQKEREDYTAYVKELFNDQRSFLIWTAVIASAIITYLFGSSRRDIKGQIDSIFTAQGESLVARKLKPIEQALEREQGYLKERILVIAPKQEDVAMEVGLLRERGFQNIDCRESAPANLEKWSIIIYRYPFIGEGEDTPLHELVDQLKTDSQTPLIVYSFNTGSDNQINFNDKQYLNAYPYHVLANFPVTLVNNVFVTLNAFSSYEN